MGLGMVRNDNGTGLRNAEVKSALMGIASANTDVRTYASADKPYAERMFGTTESVLFKLLHGYTGRKAGELPGYDAKASGVLDIDLLYEILTKFFIDEYPSLKHMGVGIVAVRGRRQQRRLHRRHWRPSDQTGIRPVRPSPHLPR